MKIPLSWLKDYIDIDLSLDELARKMTMVGLEVEEIRVVGLPMPLSEGPQEFKINGLPWDPEKFVVAQIDEVMPHPDADRLVLCRLNDGAQELIVLTGAPNLFEYKGKGVLDEPIKVAYAREGAVLYDGHKPGWQLTKLKRTKIRGVESFSMVCSEKELGISEEHEGIILLDADAPAGMPLTDYMGDAVFEVAILPNMIRDACLVGVARELSAVTGKPVKRPERTVASTAPAIEGRASIEIRDPGLNPRFVVGLIENLEPRKSPYWVQRRLRLAGMRPINSIVDATNYVMLETGEPLHAFDYDILKQRAGGKAPTIITRAAEDSEKLTTLDEEERVLDENTILVTDTAGPLSLAGIMGGMESEVTARTRNVLLEGASWNFINVRQTATRLHINSEAGYRFSRGIHPALASWAVNLGLERMAAWSGGGQIAEGLVDNYPYPLEDPEVLISESEVQQKLGVAIPAAEIAEILERLEFRCEVESDLVRAKTPPHRLDIGTGVIGKADLIEEIARIYGYDKIPATNMADELPTQRNNLALDFEEKLVDTLIGLGLQEVVNYRLTSLEREARLLPDGKTAVKPYVRLANPIAPERSVMRQSLLASVLEVLERNIRLREHLAFFEVGSIFLPLENEQLPNEPRRLVIAMSGKRHPFAWDLPESGEMDFFDLKGILERLLTDMQLGSISFRPAAHESMHPGKCAEILVGDQVVGVFGELHPRVKENYDFLAPDVLVADIDLDLLHMLVPLRFEITPVSVFPPVLEDIAVIVDESLPAGDVEALIRQTGGTMLVDVQLFDVFRGQQIGEGKKSLAYSLTYQAPDHTLTAKESTSLRNKIVKRLERELGAQLRAS